LCGRRASVSAIALPGATASLPRPHAVTAMPAAAVPARKFRRVSWRLRPAVSLMASTRARRPGGVTMSAETPAKQVRGGGNDDALFAQQHVTHLDCLLVMRDHVRCEGEVGLVMRLTPSPFAGWCRGGCRGGRCHRRHVVTP